MKKLLAGILVIVVGPVVAQAGGPYDSIYVNVPGDTMTGALNVKVTRASGKAGLFRLTNAANPAGALQALTAGLGPAGSFTATNPDSQMPALVAKTAGHAAAGYFEVTDAGSAAAAVNARTAGSGPAGDFDGWVRVSTRLEVGEDIYASGGGQVLGDLGVGGGAYVDGSLEARNGLSVTGQLGVGGNTSLEGELVVTGASSMNGGMNVTGLLNANNDVHVNGMLSAIGGAEIGPGMTVMGNLGVNGNLSATGTKNFVQPHPTDPSKELVYVAMEGPESAVFLRGTARLVDGRASIETPDFFRLAAGEAGVTVQFTPRSAASRGLAAIEVSRERVLVAELLEGTGTYEFDYFLTAKRAGFEGHRPVQDNTHFSADNVSVEEFERRFADEADPAVRAARRLLVADGILTAEGKLDRETARRLGWKVRETAAAR